MTFPFNEQPQQSQQLTATTQVERRRNFRMFGKKWNSAAFRNYRSVFTVFSTPDKRGNRTCGSWYELVRPRVYEALGSPGGLEQTRLNNLTSWVYVETLDRRYALESRYQRTIEPVRTVDQLVAIRRSSWALDDFHWGDSVVKPETAQNPHDSFAG